MDKEQWFKEAGELGGWLASYEGEYFYKLVYESRYLDGVIVEIGTYVGKSCIYFTKGLQDSDKETKEKSYIFSIDPFTGSSEHLEWAKNNEMGFESNSTFNPFIRNLKRFGVYDNVIPIATYSDTVAKWWNLPIKILFIDGSHDLDQPIRDYTNFRNHIVTNGLVVFHDTHLDETKAAIKVVLEDKYQIVYDVGSLMALRKVI
jgi:hypothetical protein